MTAGKPQANRDRAVAGPSAGSRAAVYVFTGDDETAKRQKLALARDDLLGEGDPALCLAEYDGEDPGLTAATVLDDVRTLPLLADRRVVVVHRADGFITRWRAELENYLEAPAQRGVLILVSRTFAATTNLCKRLEAINGVRRCERPKGRRELTAWLGEAARQAGKRWGADATDALLEAVGDEAGLLEAELAKLVVYVGPRAAITAADVEAIVGDNRAAAVFELSDALAGGQPGAALGVIASMIHADRSAPYQVVGYLAKHLRRLSHGRAALEGGGNDQAVCRAAGYNWTRPDFVEQVRRFDPRQLRLARRGLAGVDATLKSQPTPPRHVIEQYVFAVLGLRQWPGELGEP